MADEPSSDEHLSPDERPGPDELRRRQRDQELAEREALSEAETDADEAKHQRRADKARYLREKLDEQTEADHESCSEPPSESGPAG